MTNDQGQLFDAGPKKKKPVPMSRQLFGALCDVCGVDYRKFTPSERGRFNRASSELLKVGATVEDVRQRADIFLNQYDVRLTPTALSANWAQLEPIE